MREVVATRLGFLGFLILVPLLCGFTHYGDLAAWQAAVGPSEVEDFESFPEMRLPIEGGSIDFGRFLVESDVQGDNEWAGTSGLWRGSNWYAYPEIPDTMNLIISTEDGDPGYAGPLLIDAVFPQPIIAYALEYSWCEDVEPEDCVFDGFLLDAPTTRVSLWEPLFCQHSWCAIEAIHFATVPEPTTVSLLGLGVAALALGANRGGYRSRRR